MNSIATTSQENNSIELANRQLSKAIDSIIQESDKKKQSSYRGIAMTFRKHSEGKDSLDSFKDFLISEKYKPTTKKNCYSFMQSLIKKHVGNINAQNIMIQEISKTFSSAKKETKKSKNRIETKQDTMFYGKDYLKKDDIKKVCDYLREKPTSNKNRTDKQGNIKLALIIRFMFVTGCRVDELTQILREETFLNGVAKVMLHGKGSKSRLAEIDRQFYSEIESTFNAVLVDNKEYLFTTSIGTQLDNKNLWKRIANVFFECGYGEKNKDKSWKYSIHPHTLRHSFAMDKLDKGMDVKTLSHLLGHSDIATTLRTYISANPEKYKHLIMEEW